MYFDQQTGALHPFPWSRSFFGIKTSFLGFFHHKPKKDKVPKITRKTCNKKGVYLHLGANLKCWLPLKRWLAPGEKKYFFGYFAQRVCVMFTFWEWTCLSFSLGKLGTFQDTYVFGEEPYKINVFRLKCYKDLTKLCLYIYNKYKFRNNWTSKTKFGNYNLPVLTFNWMKPCSQAHLVFIYQEPTQDLMRMNSSWSQDQDQSILEFCQIIEVLLEISVLSQVLQVLFVYFNQCLECQTPKHWSKALCILFASLGKILMQK